MSRLPEYLRILDHAFERGEHTLSSAALGARLDGSSARVRKDLSHLGFPGTRGIGYDVAALRYQIGEALGLGAERPVAIVGLGHLGRALAAYPGFEARGLRFTAAFDCDPTVIGTGVGPDSELAVLPMADMAQVIPAAGIRMAVIAVPAHAAQVVADQLAACGVVSILSFAPVTLELPGHVHVRRSDLSAELQILAFHDRSEPAAERLLESGSGASREAIAR